MSTLLGADPHREAIAPSSTWTPRIRWRPRAWALLLVAVPALLLGWSLAVVPGGAVGARWPWWTAIAASLVLSVTALGLLMTLQRLQHGVEALRQRVLAWAGAPSAAMPSGPGHDPLAALAVALERARDALAERTHELEVERRAIFHQEKMAAVGAMAAGVLHDIGNPIAAIDGVARAMIDAQASGECAIGEGLCDPSLILRETARLEGITRMIAGLAAPPATAPQWLHVNDVVRTALLLLHFDTRLSGVHIDAALDPQLPAVVGVSDALLQLVMNLITNAGDAVRSAGGERPLIQVKTAARPDGVDITIADNGCGMSQEVLERAFEPLFTTKPSGHGTGLGLPLVRTIARQHGGEVTLHSTPGAGTRAQVHLATTPAAWGVA